jgi:Zn finger protein HypA/HybF involved in hydrogenase expression
MDSYYDQAESFWCDRCGDSVPNYEYNDGICDRCNESKLEGEGNAESE